MTGKLARPNMDIVDEGFFFPLSSQTLTYAEILIQMCWSRMRVHVYLVLHRYVAQTFVETSSFILTVCVFTLKLRLYFSTIWGQSAFKDG